MRLALYAITLIIASSACSTAAPPSYPMSTYADAGGADAGGGLCSYCSAHDNCQEHLVCNLSARVCVQPGGHLVCDAQCSLLDGCRTGGKCTASNGSCIAGSDADCQQSDSCAMSGLCSLDAELGYCVVRDDDDCKMSQGCEKAGKCRKKGNICVAG